MKRDTLIIVLFYFLYAVMMTSLTYIFIHFLRKFW